MYYPEVRITAENYDILKERMQSMDVIMFRGDDIISDTIAEIQTTNLAKSSTEIFTHAGLVIHPGLLPDYGLDPHRLYILESTYSYEITGMNNGPPDCITREPYFGVQLRDLEAVCRSYIRNDKTKVAWLRLVHHSIPQNLTEIFRRYHLRPFIAKDANQPRILSMFDLTRVTPELLLLAKTTISATWLQSILTSAFSCVNLIVSVYRDLGFISSHIHIMYPMELLQLPKYGDGYASKMGQW